MTHPSHPLGNPFALAAALLMIGLALAGCLAPGATLSDPSTDAGAPPSAPKEHADPAHVAAADRARAMVTSDEYAAVSSLLSQQPGFLGLAPSMSEAGVVYAVFEADALLPATLDVVVPREWTLRVVEDASPQRLRLPVDRVEDVSPDDSAALAPVPASSVGIGPGSPMLQTIPGEGTFICSANFVFQDGSRYFLGTAGHCLLPSDATATHGSGADYDARGVTVEVCVASCHFGGFLTGFLGDMRELGAVAYARQTGPGGDIGNDFGAVEIPSALHGLIRPEMPVWLGPTGERSSEGFGTPLVHYGNGIDAGTVFATKGRAGTSLNDGDAARWQANILINGGDSGSAINHAGASASSDVLRGTDGLGLVTHGLIVPGVPLGWGTTVGQSRSMATQANLNLALVVEGGGSGGGGSSGGGSPISLTADGYKVKGVKHTDLEWSGATTTDVDVVRDGSVVATTANDGDHTDNTGQKGGGSHTYRVCEVGTGVCSDAVTVSY